jgi:hypothetical protein
MGKNCWRIKNSNFSHESTGDELLDERRYTFNNNDKDIMKQVTFLIKNQTHYVR